MINLLKTAAKAVTPIVLDLYDREDQESVLPFLARVRGNPAMEKIVTLEWWTVFPQLRMWIGDRKTQELFKDLLTISVNPFEITYDIDRRDVDRGNSLASLEELAPEIAAAFARGKVDIAYKVLKANGLAYDGQNFFDTDHVHPEGTTYSNVAVQTTDTPARTDAANPTVQEVRAEFKIIMSKLIENSLIRNTLLRTNQVRQNLVVIARNQTTWQAFDDLLTEEQIDQQPNRFRGGFELLRDYDPPSGEEKYYDVIHAVPGGPRPVVFINSKEPTGLDVDTSSEFKNRNIPFGMDGEYGAAAGFPQTAMRWKDA